MYVNLNILRDVILFDFANFSAYFSGIKRHRVEEKINKIRESGPAAVTHSDHRNETFYRQMPSIGLETLRTVYAQRYINEKIGRDLVTFTLFAFS